MPLSGANAVCPAAAKTSAAKRPVELTRRGHGPGVGRVFINRTTAPVSVRKNARHTPPTSRKTPAPRCISRLGSALSSARYTMGQ